MLIPCGIRTVSLKNILLRLQDNTFVLNLGKVYGLTFGDFDRSLSIKFSF